MRRSLAVPNRRSSQRSSSERVEAVGRPQNVVRRAVHRNTQCSGFCWLSGARRAIGERSSHAWKRCRPASRRPEPKQWQQRERSQQDLLLAPGERTVSGEVTGNGGHCGHGIVDPGPVLTTGQLLDLFENRLKLGHFFEIPVLSVRSCTINVNFFIKGVAVDATGSRANQQSACALLNRTCR